ncbi:RNA polymerase sigma-70 factor [Flexithrix dorotheae]|uniref:RNA polymerase sigma-70 factor n=1 Tax=Flexithrix dorotheae TaxID=70993 RepID=UPI000377D577|nr:RNA polymerase sigma-70 factor [Flexithrix dorotheae]
MNKPESEYTEEEILEGLANSNEEVYKYLFNLYYEALCQFALKYIRFPEIAEEIVQDVFIYLWEKRETIQIHSSLKAYLHTAVRYQAIYYYRNASKKPIFDDNYPEERLTSGNESELLIEYLELEKQVLKSIEKLPEKCKQIFKLSRNSGLTYQQIADKMSVSKKTVENQIGIALKKLRESLSVFLS